MGKKKGSRQEKDYIRPTAVNVNFTNAFQWWLNRNRLDYSNTAPFSYECTPQETVTAPFDLQTSDPFYFPNESTLHSTHVNSISYTTNNPSNTTFGFNISHKAPFYFSSNDPALPIVLNRDPRIVSNSVKRVATNRDSTIVASLDGASTSAREVKISEGGIMQIQVASESSNTQTLDEEEDDIVYLYSVDRNEGQLVDLVDLSEDSEKMEDRNLTLPGTNDMDMNPSSSASSISDSTQCKEIPQADVSIILLEETENGSVVSASKKRKRDDSGEACCNICDANYVCIRNHGGNLFSSRCGHLFCLSCLKTLVPYKCKECDEGIANLWRIFV